MQSYFRRKRYAAGNICLVLFTAFILTILFGAVGPVNSASATDHDVNNTFDADTGAWGDEDGSKQITKGDRLKLNLGYLLPKPASDPTYKSILARVYQGVTKVKDDIQLTFDKVYDNVYGYIYSLVYNTVDVSDLLAGNYTVSFIAYGNDSAPTFDLALTVVDPGGNGGGGAAPAPAQDKKDYTSDPTTPVGTVQADNATGTTTIAVDTTKATSLLTAGSTLTIAPPAGAPQPDNHAQTTFTVGAALLEAANEKNANLLFDTGLGIPIVLSADTVNVAGLAQTLGSEFSLNVTAGVFTERESQELASQGSAGNLASNVVNLSITATNASGQSVTLQVTVKVELGYVVVQNATVPGLPVQVNKVIREYGPKTAVDVYTPLFAYEGGKGVNEDKLGVYRFNEITKKWEYIGGKVNKASKKVEAYVESYGKYAVFEYDKKFADVPASHWANKEVEIMAARHVAGGVSETEFQPEANITRIQFAAMLLRSLGIKEDWTSAPIFTDVPASWRGVAMAAYNSGLISGYGSGIFKPDQNITREEMAAMIARVLDKYGAVATLTEEKQQQIKAYFGDFGKIGDVFKMSAMKAVDAGIIKGRTSLLGGKHFAPQSNATRAESCVMLMRMLQKIGKV